MFILFLQSFNYFISFLFSSGDALECVNILHALGYNDATIDDCRVLQDICIAVSLRAARLAAAGLTCILRVIDMLPISVKVYYAILKRKKNFNSEIFKMEYSRPFNSSKFYPFLSEIFNLVSIKSIKKIMQIANLLKN